MSTLHTNLAADLAGALSLTGEALTHVDASGTATAITDGQFSPDDVAADFRAPDGSHVAETARVLIAASDVAAPAVGGHIIRDGLRWRIRTARPIAGGAYHRLEVAREAPVERTREGLRIGR